MKKFLVIVALSSALCQLSAESALIEPTIEHQDIADVECQVDEQECNLAFDAFDQFADDDAVEGFEIDFKEPLLPSWVISASLAVLLKILALQDALYDQYATLKELLGFPSSHE